MSHLESPVAARDALMQYPEQWEHIASPGHVLLARVNAYRHKTTLAMYAILATIVLVVLSQWLPQRVGAVVAWPVGKIAGLFDHKSAAPPLSPAPHLNPFASRLATTFADPSLLPAPAVIAGALQAAARNIKTGQAIDGCDTASKITDAWSTADAAVPHCRYSVDKSRLWVWGAMGSPLHYGPFMTLVRRDEKGDVVTANVIGFDPVPGYPGIDPINTFPRAVAADFPELKG